MSKSKPSAKARRSAARLAAVQALYQVDQTGIDPEAVLGEFLAHRFGAELDGERYVSPEPTLFADIVRGVAERRAMLDQLIAGMLDASWTMERVEQLLRAILRAGTWELLGNGAVPARIVIAEYVGLTDAFFSEREPGMVNAVLDRLARRLREAEFGPGH